MKKITTFFILTCLMVFEVRPQEQIDSTLIPRSTCLSNEEVTEVFFQKAEIFHLYLELTAPHPDSTLTRLKTAALSKWLTSDKKQELIKKFTPKSKDTILFKYSIWPYRVIDSTTTSSESPWTHRPLKRRQLKQVQKEEGVLLTGTELMALFEIFPFNEIYYKPRVFKILRENYCDYSSNPEIKEWVQFYKKNFNDLGYYILKI